MQPDVPTRHLTFLFADVKRSTRLTELHGAAAGAALARYHELVDRAAAAHGGLHVFERVGDGAYAVFDAARDAVAAAVELQAAIQAESWGAVGRIRIRVAVVSGDVEQRGDRYYGRPLFRAARIQGFAAGGETLLGGTTFDDLDGWVPDGMRLRDLGTSASATSRSRSASGRWSFRVGPAHRQHAPRTARVRATGPRSACSSSRTTPSCGAVSVASSSC